MRFNQFLAEAKQPSFWQGHSVIAFRTSTYPLLFFRTLFELLQNKNVIPVAFLKVEEKQKLLSALQQSFLGESFFYWLGDLLDKVKQKKGEPDFVDTLSHYRGPHAIAFFIPLDYKLSATIKKRMMIVEIPEQFTSQDLFMIFSFFGVSLTKAKKEMVHEIVEKVERPSLDTISMLCNYFMVTSSRLTEALKEKVTAIVEPELSLYALSHAFFAKQKKRFFELWSERHNDYTMPFWVAYWSEQIWRAYHVVTFLKQSNFPAARRFSYRLPASFLKNDWRHCSPHELEKAYRMLYEIDFAFKTGSTFCSLDLWYCKYFVDSFA